MYSWWRCGAASAAHRGDHMRVRTCAHRNGPRPTPPHRVCSALPLVAGLPHHTSRKHHERPARRSSPQRAALPRAARRTATRRARAPELDRSGHRGPILRGTAAKSRMGIRHPSPNAISAPGHLPPSETDNRPAPPRAPPFIVAVFFVVVCVARTHHARASRCSLRVVAAAAPPQVSPRPTRRRARSPRGVREGVRHHHHHHPRPPPPSQRKRLVLVRREVDNG